MDRVATRAKELNKDLDEILRQLNQLDYVNQDKNKIDFLYEILEKSMENVDHVEII